jgi:hypothetical protein
MNLITFPAGNKVAETGLYQPAISIILPFDCTHQKNPTANTRISTMPLIISLKRF